MLRFLFWVQYVFNTKQGCLRRRANKQDIHATDAEY